MEMMKHSMEEIIGFTEQLDGLFKLISDTLEQRPVTLNGERYLSVSEVAGLLNLNPATILNYCNQGLIGYIKITRLILLKESDIYNLLEKNYISAWGDR